MARAIRDPGIDLTSAVEGTKRLHIQYCDVTGNTAEYKRLGDSLELLRTSLGQLLDYVESEQIRETIEPTFAELSSGLADTIAELTAFVGSFRSVHDAELLLIDDDRIADTTVWLEDTYYMLQYYFWVSKILYNVIQKRKPKAQTRSLDNTSAISRHAERSAKLDRFLTKLFAGTNINESSSIGSKLGPGTMTLKTDGSKRQGRLIELELKLELDVLVRDCGPDLPEERLMLLKIRHALYWLSVTEDNLRVFESRSLLERRPSSSQSNLKANEPQDLDIKLFLDSIKCVWMIRDPVGAYVLPTLTEELRKIVFEVERRILELLDYICHNLSPLPTCSQINDRGDFSIRMSKRNAVVSGDRSTTGSFLGIVESALMDVDPPELRTNPLANTSDDEVGPAGNQTHAGDPEGVTIITDVQPTPIGRNTIEGIVDGLHITALETPAGKEILGSMAAVSEIEVFNPESNSKDGFHVNIFSLDSSSAQDNTYTQSRIRIYKGRYASGAQYIRLRTERDSRVHNSQVDLEVELVPIYSSIRAPEVYLRRSGIPASLRYKFVCEGYDGSPCFHEFFGFQSVLLSADFELDFPLESVLFCKKSSKYKEREREPKLQFWTETSESYMPNSPTSSLSPVFPKEMGPHIITQNVGDSVLATKLFMFCNNFIYVIIVSDRIILERPHGIFRSKPHTPSLKLIPNKHSGCSTIRVRIIKGDHVNPAGIPLNHATIKFADQSNAELFDDYKSVELEFKSESDCSSFEKDYRKLVEAWKLRCAPIHELRRLHREQTVSTRGKIVIDKKMRS